MKIEFTKLGYNLAIIGVIIIIFGWFVATFLGKVYLLLSWLGLIMMFIGTCLLIIRSIYTKRLKEEKE